jgi:hypothetical protein
LSHNTQPWRLRANGHTLGLRPDFARRTPVVDPDDRHVYVSLGSAAKDAVVAGSPFGLAEHVEFAPSAAFGMPALPRLEAVLAQPGA